MSGDHVGLGLEAKVNFLQAAEAFYKHQLKQQGYYSGYASSIPLDVVDKP